MKFGKNLSHAETCIRLTALENNEEVPHDILTLILQTIVNTKFMCSNEAINDAIFVMFIRDYSIAGILHGKLDIPQVR